MVACGRSCCLCHKFCSSKIECHHIQPEGDGGADTYENCIPLCFDCHAEVGSYNLRHPRGTKFTPEELRRHRDRWYEKQEQGSGSLITDERYKEMDKILFLKIVNDILRPDHMREFISGRDFGNSFNTEDMSPLRRFDEVYCNRSDFEFMDPDLETAKSNLRAAIARFSMLLATNTFPLRGNPRFCKIPDEWEIDDPVRFHAVIDELNGFARQVWEGYTEFIRMGRRKLEVPFVE